MREYIPLAKNSLKNSQNRGHQYGIDNNYITRLTREDIQLAINRIKNKKEQVEDIDME